MAMFVWVQLILAATCGVPGSGGATAPTHERLGTLIRSVCDLAPVDSPKARNPHAWGTLFTDARELRTASGQIVQFRSTKKQSEAIGSPIQGYTWNLFAALDECQDQIDAYADIVARMRGGVGPVMATATAKDSSSWRTWRDSLSENWTVERISYADTPFVHAEHWAYMKAECTEREWQRRALAMDVGPELMTYTTWRRSVNLRPIPAVGAKNVTALVQGRFARNVGLLIGHDPGSLCDVSLFLQFFKLPESKNYYIWVCDEVTTERTTTEEHVLAVLDRLEKRWGIFLDSEDGAKPLVRIDPWGESDSRTGKSVYAAWKLAGFDARSAAFKNGKGNGKVPKEGGIEMVCRLLCNANGESRLFIDVDDRGRPVAPRLVQALELSERNIEGRAETQKKDKKDLSHWPAALRYALWPTEHPRVLSSISQGVSVG